MPKSAGWRLSSTIIVDLAVADQRRPAGLVDEWLAAGSEIDDGKPGMGHGDVGRLVPAGAVGPAMGQGASHALEQTQLRRAAGRGHKAGDAAHQRARAATTRMAAPRRRVFAKTIVKPHLVSRVTKVAGVADGPLTDR